MNRRYTKKRRSLKKRSLTKKKRKNTFRKQRGGQGRTKAEQAEQRYNQYEKELHAKRSKLAEGDARREEKDQIVRQAIRAAINDNMTMEEKRKKIKEILKANYPEKTDHNLNVESFIRSSLRKRGNFKPRTSQKSR